MKVKDVYWADSRQNILVLACKCSNTKPQKMFAEGRETEFIAASLGSSGQARAEGRREGGSHEGGGMHIDGGKFYFNLGLNKKWSYLSVLD